MNKLTTIMTLLFSLLVSSGAFAFDFNNLDEEQRRLEEELASLKGERKHNKELSFRQSVADKVVCLEMAHLIGDLGKRNQIYALISKRIALHVCKSKKVADYTSCALDYLERRSENKKWRDIDSYCNSMFSSLGQEEFDTCYNASNEYLEKRVEPISSRKIDRIYDLSELSGDDIKTTATAFYAENCPY